jgi:hypothetical protein
MLKIVDFGQSKGQGGNIGNLAWQGGIFLAYSALDIPIPGYIVNKSWTMDIVISRFYCIN